jgi:hypothetical protein
MGRVQLTRSAVGQYQASYIVADFMRPADSRKRLELAGLGAGVVLGAALAALGLSQARTDGGVRAAAGCTLRLSA